MKRQFLCAITTTFVTFVLSAGIYYLTDLETTLGLDSLFHFRGIRTPPAEVLVVAMDEKSETRLSLGQDLTRWRGFHARLIQQLQRHGASLIVFDLQFIESQADVDSGLAKAMRNAGNVLLPDCVQKFLHATEDFFGREECSESHKEPAVTKEGTTQQLLPEQLVAIRKISPAPNLAESALDHAPIFLLNDAQNSSVREAWTFYDGLAETPSLPVVAWLYYLQRSGDLKINRQFTVPLSVWLTEQRRQCLSENDQPPDGAGAGSGLEQRAKLIICQEDSHYLDFYGPPQTFRMESYSDVYEGKVADLQGKVIFVGKANRKYSSGKTDFFQTPFTDTRSGKMAGVEIIATQFANLLEDRTIKSPLPPWLFLAAFSLLLSLSLAWLPGLTGLLTSTLLSGSYTLLAFWCFTRNALWLPLAVPLLIQLPLSWLISLFWSRRELLDERKRILAFVRQVFPQWLHILPALPGQWYPEKSTDYFTFKRDVTGLCLATDIEGYTSVAAQHTPHEMWELLKAYYHVLGFPVSSHQGIIANIQGDAMMALWIDLPPEVQRHSACLAALEIALEVERFNKSANAVDPLPTRIGLHEGEMVLGSGESGGFRFYNPFGDTVNTASRIQGINKFLGTQILASKNVVENLTNVIYRAVGRFRVEGKKEALELVEIIGASPDSTGSLALYNEFASGLDLFQRGKWAGAADIFQNILNKYGTDSPTRYYLELASVYQNNPPPEWDGIVTLERK